MPSVTKIRLTITAAAIAAACTIGGFNLAGPASAADAPKKEEAVKTTTRTTAASAEKPQLVIVRTADGPKWTTVNPGKQPPPAVNKPPRK